MGRKQYLHTNIDFLNDLCKDVLQCEEKMNILISWSGFNWSNLQTVDLVIFNGVNGKRLWKIPFHEEDDYVLINW